MMKLWLLRPFIENLDDNPWYPWYDKAFGFVVRAETEESARNIANKNGGVETGPIDLTVYRVGGDPWLDPAFSSCVELLADEGDEGVVITDLRYG
jgi:hypothetical protein